YLVSTGNVTLHQSMINSAIGTALLACMIPVFGYISDHVKKNKLLVSGNILILMLYYPIFKLILIGSDTTLLIGQLSLAFIIALFAGPLASITAETFSTETRYTGISMGINLGATIFGGT